MATLKKDSEDPKPLHRTLYFQHQQQRQKLTEQPIAQKPANQPAEKRTR